MSKNTIKFFEKPKRHVLITIAGTGNPYYSKKEAYEAITSSLKNEIIKPADFEKMRDEILNASEEQLPWSVPKNGKISIEIITIGGSPSMKFGLPPGFMVRSPFENPFELPGLMEMLDGSLGIGLDPRSPFEDLFGFLGLMEIIDNFIDIGSNPQRPTFVPCSCGKKHGEIYTKTKKTGMISSLKEGEEILQIMFERNIITEEEKQEVSTQIKEFFDPEIK